MSPRSAQAHYNAPKFFAELGRSLQEHSRMVLRSFSVAFSVYSLFAVAGLGLFGKDLQGNMLRNYPVSNKPILLAWLGMAISVTFTYPFTLITGREAQ